mmetsp:Transcript_105/g.386  ORF Transcript_105/g.386 Transcript_105/m.386 type:complete len:472 (-) Transcript_105:197-1612(-)
MYHMASELLEEMPCHFALFACGAVGWGLTRWANMRFGTDRQAVQPLKAKLLETEETEEVEEPMAAEGTPMEAEEEEVMPVTQTNPISPAAGAAARRRANRRKGRDQPLAARGAACEEVDAPAVAVEEAIIEVPITLVGKAKDEEDLVPPCSTRPVRAASVEEPEPEVVPPTPSSAFPLLEQSIDEPESVPADEAPEVSHGVSERVAKLLAKKAERKARKAHERELEEQQQGEAAEAALAAAARLQELRIDVASIEAEVEAEEAEVEEEALSLVSTSEPEGHHVATDEEDEDADEDEAAWPSTPRSELAQQDEVWMAGCLTQDVVPSVPIGAEFVQTSEGSMITAVDPCMHRYHPILSDDGQQLYTDGEQVYVMACVDTSASAGSAEDAGGADSPQVMHAVTDPWDPMHQVVHELQLASTGSEYCGEVYMGATYGACGDYSAQEWPQEMMYQSQLPAGGGHDDGLWDVPWDF